MITTRHGRCSKDSMHRRCSMSLNSGEWRVDSGRSRKVVFGFLLTAYCLLAFGCGVRFDMQDQPRYKAYKKSEFFADNRASRDVPEGTVARGFLKENKAFYTGKIDNPNANVQVETTTNAQ